MEYLKMLTNEELKKFCSRVDALATLFKIK